MNPVVPRSEAGELRTRIASAVVLAAFAVATAIAGGAYFVLLWAVAAIGVFWEWSAIVAGGAATVRLAGCTALLGAAAALIAGTIAAAVAALATAIALCAIIAPHSSRAWAAAGVAYSGTLLLAPVVLRGDPQLGRTAILFLFAVVWATDIGGYFTGRWLGGARLAPTVSPGKTWSGACGGALGAIAGGLALMHATGEAGTATTATTACLAVALSVVAQAGDLLESAVKRRFAVKDASKIIPGHGGLMDRLDGFLAAAGAAALIGLARGGRDASAQGLLVW